MIQTYMIGQKIGLLHPTKDPISAIVQEIIIGANNAVFYVVSYWCGDSIITARVSSEVIVDIGDHPQKIQIGFCP